MRKNLALGLVFALFLGSFPVSAQGQRATGKVDRVEIYTPENNPLMFNRLAKEHPELGFYTLEDLTQVVMELAGSFKAFLLTPGTRVLADEDGNIKYAQCGNEVIVGKIRIQQTAMPAEGLTQETVVVVKDAEKMAGHILDRYFDQMSDYQKKQQELQEKQIEQQGKFLEFLSLNQKTSQQNLENVVNLQRPRNDGFTKLDRFVLYTTGITSSVFSGIAAFRGRGGTDLDGVVFNLTQTLTSNPALSNTNNANVQNNPVIDVASSLQGGNNTASNTAQGGNAQGGNAQGGNSNASNSANSTANNTNTAVSGANSNSGASASNDNKNSSVNNNQNDNPTNVGVTSTNTSNNSASNDNRNSNTGTNSNNNSNQQNQGQAQNQASTNNNSGGTAGNPTVPPTVGPPREPSPDPVVNVGNGSANNTHNSGNGNSNRPPQPVLPPLPQPPPNN